MLKSQGRLGNKRFSAKLVFRLMGVAPRIDEDELTDAAEIR